MEFTQHSALVKTRFLILSDTHGVGYQPDQMPLQYADVAIHCGDLTEGSQLAEFRTSIQLLKDINAPLKLVIAGNHDFTLDIPAFRKKVDEARPAIEPNLVKEVYGDYGDVRWILDDARAAGIIFLDEGNHQFTLENGAKLTVYASPWTPSLGDWGFQYLPTQGHNFEVTEGVDLVITHGPPKGIMDYTDSKQRAGCSDLFGAIARSRPRLHCFGHIHEGWGAKLVAWRDQVTETPSHFTDIDNERSYLVEKLSGFKQSKFDTPEAKEQKSRKKDYYRQERCYATSHCSGDTNPLESGTQTLFVNAAIQSTDEDTLQLPWLVDLEIPKLLRPPEAH